MATVAVNLNKLWERAMFFGSCVGCHQRSDRSFFIKGYQAPVCARCTGVFFGQIIALINFFAFPSQVYLPLALLAMGIMFIDWLIQKVGLLESTNPRRFITGSLGGYGVLLTVIIGGQALIF